MTTKPPEDSAEELMASVFSAPVRRGTLADVPPSEPFPAEGYTMSGLPISPGNLDPNTLPPVFGLDGQIRSDVVDVAADFPSPGMFTVLPRVGWARSGVITLEEARGQYLVSGFMGTMYSGKHFGQYRTREEALKRSFAVIRSLEAEQAKLRALDPRVCRYCYNGDLLDGPPGTGCPHCGARGWAMQASEAAIDENDLRKGRLERRDVTNLLVTIRRLGLTIRTLESLAEHVESVGEQAVVRGLLGIATAHRGVFAVLLTTSGAPEQEKQAAYDAAREIAEVPEDVRTGAGEWRGVDPSTVELFVLLQRLSGREELGAMHAMYAEFATRAVHPRLRFIWSNLRYPMAKCHKVATDLYRQNIGSDPESRASYAKRVGVSPAPAAALGYRIRGTPPVSPISRTRPEPGSPSKFP